jgi:hypothetical protein
VQRLQVAAAVIGVGEDRRVVLAALQHVVRQSGEGKAGQASHGEPSRAAVKKRLSMLRT